MVLPSNQEVCCLGFLCFTGTLICGAAQNPGIPQTPLVKTQENCSFKENSPALPVTMYTPLFSFLIWFGLVWFSFTVLGLELRTW
jgi:hypothetical protein